MSSLQCFTLRYYFRNSNHFTHNFKQSIVQLKHKQFIEKQLLPKNCLSKSYFVKFKSVSSFCWCNATHRLLRMDYKRGGSEATYITFICSLSMIIIHVFAYKYSSSHSLFLSNYLQDIPFTELLFLGIYNMLSVHLYCLYQ